jgi:hypothetical protein
MAQFTGEFAGGFDDVEVNPPVAAFADFESVEERLVQAFVTMDQLPDREARFLKVQIMALWREVRPEEGDVLETSPGRPGVFLVEHKAMMEALGWCEWLSGDERRLVGRVIEQLRKRDRVEWPEIRRELASQRTTDALRKAYGRALERICARLNAGTGGHFCKSR